MHCWACVISWSDYHTTRRRLCASRSGLNITVLPTPININEWHTTTATHTLHTCCGCWSHMKTRKLSYHKDRAMRPICGCPEKFPESWLANGYFSRNCNGLLFRSILRMCVQNWKFVALPVPEIIGGNQNMGSPWIRPHCLFSQIFKGLLFIWFL